MILTELIHHCNHIPHVSLQKCEISTLADMFPAQKPDFMLLFWLDIASDARVASPGLADSYTDRELVVFPGFVRPLCLRTLSQLSSGHPYAPRGETSLLHLQANCS